MNVTIIYFSQTGNTRKVADTMAQAFREAGHVARMVSLKKAIPQDATTPDLLGVGTPCFSSQAPTPIKAFLSSLPLLDKQRAFVFATSGGAPGRVLYDLTRLLQGKGANVVGGFLTRGELHHPAPCMIGRMPNRPNAEDLARARHFAAAVTEHVLVRRPGPVAESRPDTFRPKLGFYNFVALLSTDGFLRLALPEPKPDSARCDQCQWCVNECPMRNIILQPYPVLGHKCIRCYRCLTGCPQKAFDADWRLGNLAVLSFYNTTFERWFGDLEAGERIY
jgi:flavodoxin/NAD-dependent dihydropyrimidine dehydrogenase PreA subunit